MVPALAPKTLRWVRGFLPSDEGDAWLAEVTSCLAETTDKGERQRYVRALGVGSLTALAVAGRRRGATRS